MEELFPVGCGLLLGTALGYVRPGIRIPVGILFALLLGVLATVVTGEFKTSWSYLLIDIPLVAASATIGFLAGRRVRGAPNPFARLTDDRET
jgi:hypothetical protein